MKTSDVPSMKVAVMHLAEQLDWQEMDIPTLKEANKQDSNKMKAFAGIYVGSCTLKTIDGQDTIMAIRLNDDFFQVTHPTDYTTLPLGCIVRFVSTDEVFIFINTLTQTLLRNDATYDIAAGLLGHELGHFAAGHFARNAVVKRPYLKGDSVAIIEQLLAGGLGDPLEMEANMHAIQLVGLGPLLANIAMQSSLSSSIGIRMLFSNHLHHILRLVATGQLGIPKSIYTEVGVEILADEDFDSLHEQTVPN
jgi:Peptidase family M48